MMIICEFECRQSRIRQRGANLISFRNFAAEFCNLEAQRVAKVTSKRTPYNQHTHVLEYVGVAAADAT